MTLSVGESAPDFSLPDQNGRVHSLNEYRGKWVLIYFYPKDDTPGCTVEACGFRDRMKELQKRNIALLGVSKDSVESHQKFVKKYSLPFPLLVDPEKTMIEEYGAWGEKKFLGKTFMGIFRMSYLIDPEGKIAKVYEKVKSEGHAEEVLKDIEALQ